MANKHGKAKAQGGGKIKVADKAEEQLIEEIERLRQEVAALRQEKTERKKAEEALRESEEEYRNLFESAPESITLLSLDGTVLDANSVSQVVTGLSREEVIGKHFAELGVLNEKDFLKYTELLSRHASGESIQPFEVELTVKGGKTCWLEVFPGLLKKDNKPYAIQVITRDITERKRAEAALRESEARYRTILENIEDGYFEVDIVGNFTFGNNSLCKIHGYTKDEMIGINNREYMDKKTSKQVYQLFNKVYTTGKPSKGHDWEIIRKDGTKRFVDGSISLIRDAQGKRIGFRGIIRDITERKRAEAALRESEARYRTIIESIVEGYFEVNLAGNYTLVNDAICRKLGYSRDELLGMNNRDYMDKENARKVLERFAEVYTTGQPARGFEFDVARKDGTKLVISSSVSLITDSQGQPTGFRGVVRNITEQKQAEEMLRENEARYRTILESIEHGYLEVDIRGNLTFFNDSMCEIIGYPRDEMMGMNNRQYMDEENAKKVYQTFNKVYTTGKPAQGFDWELIRKDGTKRIVEASVSLVRDSEGKPTGFRGIVRDITERRKAEAEKKALEQKAQLASRLSIVGEMASGIVHEINNPLTSVVGFAEMLAQKKDIPEDAREYARIINNEGQRLTNIASRLLNFTRYQKPETVYTAINELIETTLQLQTYEMTTGNIKITTKLDPHLPRTMADPGQLQQVFLNIMVNARRTMRATHGGGKFLIKTEALDDTIRISLADDGPGIPKENLKRIFDSFFTTRKAREGTGLGLSICQGIISRHDGKIYAKSTLGKGATFIIELPVVARKRKAATTARANTNNVWR